MDERFDFSPDGYAAWLIGQKARQVSRTKGFTDSDRSDIERDLVADLFARHPRYDPSKASVDTFVARIVEHAVASLIRHRLADSRSPMHEECSLNDPVLDADGRTVDRHETTPEATTDGSRLRDLERDMALVLARLPDELRPIALGLARGTPHAVGAELGLSRRAMTKAIEQIRDAFREAGLDQYL